MTKSASIVVAAAIAAASLFAVATLPSLVPMETTSKRLNKFLSEAGYCSRRAADKLIEEGRVLVNGSVPEMGTKIRAEDLVEVDGKVIKKKKIAILNLSKIQNILDKNKHDLKNNFDLKILKEKKLIKKDFSKLKILGSGEIKTSLEISAHFASKQALEKVQKAGGKLNIIKK